jgi:hypothetical protein
MSHHVYELSFGPHFPGLVNPLDGFERVIKAKEEFQAYKYFIKVWVEIVRSLEAFDLWP